MSVSVANTDAQLSGKTLMTLDANQTITGLKTYDRGTSAPFAIVSGAAKVTNLDADKLDGLEGSAYAVLAAVTNAFTGSMTLAGLLTVSGFGTNSFSGNANGANILDLANAATGTAARSIFRVLIDGNDQLTLSSFSSGYTTSGTNIASSGKLDVNSSGGLSVVASHASGAIRFYSGGTTLRARFDTDGRLNLNPDGTTGATNGLLVETDQNSRVGVTILPTSDVVGGTFIRLANAAGTEQGSIYALNSTTIVFATSSDQRLKTDQGLAIDLSHLRALRIHDFIWTESGAQDRNVFAQEAFAVSPRGVKRGTDGDVVGNSPWSFEKAAYVPDLIVGWQQHDATIQQLIARVAQLEARH